MKLKYLLFFLILSPVVFGEIISVPSKEKIYAVRTSESLSDMLKQVENKIKDGRYPKEGITVLLEPGVFKYSETTCLGPEFHGTKERPIVIKVKNGGKAIFQGGQPLDLNSAELVTDVQTISRLGEKAAGNVYRLHICNTEHQQLLTKAEARLSMGGRMMSLCRYPNVGFAHIDQIIDAGAIYAHGRTPGDPPTYSNENPIGGTFTVLKKDIHKWENEFERVHKGSVTGYLAYDWYRQNHQIASISNEQIKLLEYSRYGVLNKEKIPRRFYVSNLLCELDAPGEFYYDDASDYLYFWPFGETLGGKVLSIWAGKAFLQMNKSSNVRFENIVVEGVAEGSSVVEIKDCENIEFAGCTVRNCSCPAFIIDGGRNCGILSCDIYDVPHHLTLKGGDTRHLIPSGHYAKNCHFTQIYASDFYGRIQIEGVGQIFQNNLIHNFIGQVMTVNGNDNHIEYNEFFNIGIEEGDGGTIYSGAEMWSWGNVYRHNFLHHLMCIPQAHPRGGIYPDDRDQGDIITQNIFYKAAHRAVLLNGGAGHTVTSNLFLNGYIGVYNTDGGAEKMFEMQSEYDSGKLKRGDKMDYIWRTEQIVGKQGWNLEPWKSHYPLFAKIMNQEKRRFWPIECVIYNNCFSGNRFNTLFITTNDQGKRLEIPFEKVNYMKVGANREIEMSIFSDPKKLNFTYQKDCSDKDLPTIEFEKIGLMKDEFRISPPNKNDYRMQVREHFKNHASFDEDAIYDPDRINDELYFNTGSLIFGL